MQLGTTSVTQFIHIFGNFCLSKSVFDVFSGHSWMQCRPSACSTPKLFFLKSAGIRLEAENQPAWGQCGWAGSLGVFCHKHKMKSWGFYHRQLIITSRSSPTQTHYSTNITTWLSAASCSVLNTAPLLQLPAHLMNSIAMFAQSSSCANKPWRARLALPHSMEWRLHSCCPQTSWRKWCTGRPISISAESVSILQGWHWNQSTKYIQRILGRALWLRLCHTPTLLQIPLGCITCMPCQANNGSLC